MGRVGKVLFDLLRFQVPVIDDALSFITLLLAIVVFVGVVAFALFWPLWHFLVRPIAAQKGIVKLTSYDYLVRGWKAERQGRWTEALQAYDLAIELEPSNSDAQARRESLVATHPELLAQRKPL